MSWTLGAALVLWSPVALSVLAGDRELAEAGPWFLAALALAWIGTGIFSYLLEGYRRSADQVAMAKRQIEVMERRAEAKARRRTTDAAEPERSDRPDSDLPPSV